MAKTGLIIGREYLMRVRNRTFLAMCFIVPLLWAGLVLLPPMLAGKNVLPRTVVVVDETGCDEVRSYAGVFRDTMNLHFDMRYKNLALNDVKKQFKDSMQTSILWIPQNFMGGCKDTLQEHSPSLSLSLFSRNEPGRPTVNYIETAITEEVRKDLMELYHIPVNAIELARKKVNVTSKVNDQVSQGDIKLFVALVAGGLIYIYIMIFGLQVMRSVVEEKTSRIIEVIISSVRPFQLMMGKIIAVALTGLTQFFVWIVLSLLILVPFISSIQNQKLDPDRAKPQAITQTIPTQDHGGFHMEVNEKMEQTVDNILSIPWATIIIFFLLYFLLGYLLYASIFAALGSAVDSETDMQQFQFPVTLPLIFSFVMSSAVLAEPNGPVSEWLSMIPFTSPVVMMMRLPYGSIPIWEPIVSLVILFVTFLFFTWLAGRVYRVGILMYGKKPSWRELGKWIFYKG